METIQQKIAYLVNQQGGRAFYVGGCVRDKLLDIDSNDIDIEVHGIEPHKLLSILKSIGEPTAFGTNFGIYALKGYDIDIALPRKEHSVGMGHKDFEICIDAFIGTLGAAKRRDFTINALMEDILTGEIIDYFGGQKDLQDGVIRHIDKESFVEDPLRVLRGAQFAARFGFEVAEETVELCSNIDISMIAKERVQQELKKALLKGKKPSLFFENLRNMEQLDYWFPEIKSLIGIEQDPIFHPEGDVWNHTMEVIDRASKYVDEVKNPFGFMMLALTHDLGKIETTEIIKGRIHAYKHEIKGLPIVDKFVRRITNESAIIDYVMNMVPLHMKPNVVAYNKSSVKSTNRMFDEAIAPKDLIYFAMSDKPVMVGDMRFNGDSEFLFERFDLFCEIMEKPYVAGKDLIDAGLTPGAYFSDILSYAHKLRLAGVEKESALKQSLAYATKYKTV